MVITFKNNLLFKGMAGCVMAVTLTALTSCSEWDDHYEGTQQTGTGQNLMQMLEQNSQTSSFASFVRQAGYADLLASSQSFTVFAPSNEALSGISSNDATTLSRIISNHIARYTYPTSTEPAKGVQMLNGKIYYFSSEASFAGSTISDANERADNGLVHRLSQQIPYVNNLYEYIEGNPNTSKLYEFLHSFDEVKFDDEASIEIDVDDQGRPVYDTVWVNYNRLLEDEVYGIGAIATEDSSYTMVVPTNEAWDAAYERIAPSFKVYHADEAVADSLQDIRTKLAIVSDLIYREPIAALDSALSTTGSIIHSPAVLLAGTTMTSASNGIIYTAPILNYDNTETWNKPLNVEAEEQNGRTYNNTLTSVYTRTVTANSLIEGVSEDSYIEVMPISTSTNPTVIFDIPDALAGTYNVYAVFLPPTVEGATEDTDSTRITFTISYQNEKGRTGNKSNKDKTLLTSGTQVVKMLAFENLEIPVSNTTDRLWLMDDHNDISDVPVTTQLTIATNVTAKEFSSKELSRSFRLDRIILEPIKH